MTLPPPDMARIAGALGWDDLFHSPESEYPCWYLEGDVIAYLSDADLFMALWEWAVKETLMPAMREYINGRVGILLGGTETIMPTPLAAMLAAVDEYLRRKGNP